MTATTHPATHAPDVERLLAAADFFAHLHAAVPLPDDALAIRVERSGITGQLVRAAMPPGRRHHTLGDIARGVLHTTIATVAYTAPVADAAYWGALHVHGSWAGLPVDIWTGLSLDDARTLGLAVCTDCGHLDHDGDDCLAAITSPEGFEDARCLCGPPPDAIVVHPRSEAEDLVLAEARIDAEEGR